jgi:hypothetical protein
MVTYSASSERSSNTLPHAQRFSKVFTGHNAKDRDQEVMTIQEAAQVLRLQVSTLYEKKKSFRCGSISKSGRPVNWIQLHESRKIRLDLANEVQYEN